MRARAIMVLGTGSHVGKSLITAALCRIFAQQGYKVAPFKSQNMSLNSAATIEGLEIGRAQALQAEAARVAPSVHMNPILIKPSGELSSQVVVRGKIWGSVTAADYHQRRVEDLMPLVRESYELLAAEHDIVLLEGAGSPAEINLKQHDIANMRMAKMADATCLLVGDIDRGGVFASLLGTLELLEPEEQERIRGFAINKFRGDLNLLTPGLRMIEARVRKPCLGVVPYLQSLHLEEEDSLGLPFESATAWTKDCLTDESPHRALRIAVIAPPSFSNFTDFDSLRVEPSVSLIFCRTAKSVEHADLVILPGTKQTVDDLLWMRRNGLEGAVKSHAERSLTVGICGGMQMLGESITDPCNMEHEGRVSGLGLLPIRTVMGTTKVTRNVSGEIAVPFLFGQRLEGFRLSGYEIHIGQTSYAEDAGHFITLSLDEGAAGFEVKNKDGCISSDTRTFGTYLHGIFDNDEFRHNLLNSARAFHGLACVGERTMWKQIREDSLSRLALEVSKALDMKAIFEWVGLGYDNSPSMTAALDRARGESILR